jgi:hypothetical protein
LSEQYPSDAAPAEEEAASQSALLPGSDKPKSRHGRSGWIASAAPVPRRLLRSEKNRRSRSSWIVPAWFFLGIIVGIAGFAAYNALTVRLSASATVAQAESVDPNTAIKTAAREGVLEAIATLQAGGGQAAAQEPQVVADNTFAVRDANRQGSANATVTVFEFSDFQ